MARGRTKLRWRLAAWDLGRALARALCLVFALLGLLPVTAFFLAKSGPIQDWASEETTRVVHELLGVAADYQVEVSAVPLQVRLLDLSVAANDGGTPVLEARRVTIAPRLFSLLAGRLDIGDVEIEAALARVVIKDGELQNLSYRLPQTASREQTLRSPFTSLAITDARLDLEIDDLHVISGAVDLDVFAEEDLTFEVALRVSRSELSTARPEAVDRDVICQLDARLRVDPDEILVRRLALIGAADLHDGRLGQTTCDYHTEAEAEDAEARVAVRLSQFRLRPEKGAVPWFDGQVFVRVPVGLANRLTDVGPFTGWVGFTGNAHYDQSSKLPSLSGKLATGQLTLAGRTLLSHAEGRVQVQRDAISIPELKFGWANGDWKIEQVAIRPFEPGAPLSAERTEGRNLTFPGIMRDVDVTDDTIVAWDINRMLISDFKGTLDPPSLEGRLYSETQNFEVFNRSFRDPARRHMIGVKQATLDGRIAVRNNALSFLKTRATFGNSSMLTSVSIGFDNRIKLEVFEDSKIDLTTISPLVDIPLAGEMLLDAEMTGEMGDPVLSGNLSVSDFVFAGFPLGHVNRGKVRFQPLKVDLTDVQGSKGNTDFVIPKARLNFDTDAAVLADAEVTSERMDIRDFFAMWHFDQDPRWDQIRGSMKTHARVSYALGGSRDTCKSGDLRVTGKIESNGLDLYEEHYDSAKADFEFHWQDIEASYLGIELDAPAVSLGKGKGTLLGSLRMDYGAQVNGHFVASGVPLSRLQALGRLGNGMNGTVSGMAELSGSVDALSATVQAAVSPVRIGRSQLPASKLYVQLKPRARPSVFIGKSGCGRPVPAPFELADYEKDHASGVFHVSGNLFGKQLQLDDLEVTRQRHKRVKGSVAVERLNLGALAELSPDVALGATRPEGSLSGRLEIESFPLGSRGAAKATAHISEAWVRYGDTKLRTEQARSIVLDGDSSKLGTIVLAATLRDQRSVFDLTGEIVDWRRRPDLRLELRLRPTPLATFRRLFPETERLAGTLSGVLRLKGPYDQLRQSGQIRLDNGEIGLRSLPAPLTNLTVELALDTGSVRVAQGQADFGGGRLSFQGSAPLSGFKLGDARAAIQLRDVTLPVADGVRMSFDADLQAQRKAVSTSEKASLPRVTGNVNLRSFVYSRPAKLAADISTLAQRGRRTKFESYNPENEVVAFEINVHGQQALKLSNNLIEADLAIDESGLLLTGTNQRYGMRGRLNIEPGGKIHLRRNEFEVQQGHVRFDDATRIAPRVDVTAVTEYRRYHSSFGASGDETNSAGTAGGLWRITLHAHGDAEKLRVDLSSSPEMSEDDIFLLLTLGLTRAELDQAQSAQLGESVALEALGTLSGADQAVREAIPVIDEFRFGSAYSSRTGQTEPTITIGKRLTDRIRAFVTSGITESREIRSNLEWRLNRRVSVEGSYDNVNDISSSNLGNLGADIRWRLEFE